MLFRLALVVISIGLVLLTLTQLVWPALTHRPFFPFFRGETPLQRAERLKADALEQKKTVETEAEIIRLDLAAQRIRDQAFSDLIDDPPTTKPPETPK